MLYPSHISSYLETPRTSNRDLPFDAPLAREKAALHAGDIRFHQLRDRFEVALLTAKISFTDLVFTLPPRSASHLPPGNLVKK
jgi:hypothetical protein